MSDSDVRLAEPTTGTPSLSSPPRSVPVSSGVPVEERFRLPAHRGKVGRVSDHATELVEDAKEWMELRIELVKKEVERRIEGRLSTIKDQAIVGGAAVLTAYFGLFALAFGLGALFGHPAWGFLALTVILAFGTWMLKRKFMPGTVSVQHSPKTGKIEVRHDPEVAEHETPVSS